MRHFHFAAAALLGILLLTGCGNNETSAAEGSTEVTETGLTAVTTEAPVPATTAAPTITTAAETTTAAATSETAESTSTTLPPLATAQNILTTQQAGGQGGEEHAEDPEPLYFSYRFAADFVSMRLAGGNYQTIYYDFSEAAAREDIEELYTLSDFDFDGNPDLAVPVQFANANTVYAIFLWNPETMYYEEEPLQIINPVPYAETKTITSLAQDSAAVWVMTTYTLEDGVLTAAETATADFEAGTLTVQPLTGNAEPAVTEFSSSEELEAALIAQP